MRIVRTATHRHVPVATLKWYMVSTLRLNDINNKGDGWDETNKKLQDTIKNYRIHTTIPYTKQHPTIFFYFLYVIDKVLDIEVALVDFFNLFEIFFISLIVLPSKIQFANFQGVNGDSGGNI